MWMNIDLALFFPISCSLLFDLRAAGFVVVVSAVAIEFFIGVGCCSMVWSVGSLYLNWIVFCIKESYIVSGGIILISFHYR